MDLVPRPAGARRQGVGQEVDAEEVAGAAPALAALRERIAGYYGAKVRRHGATPAGADWTCALTQELRFIQLLRICDWSGPFSIDDLGCGWGALRGFMSKRHRGAKADYLGIDVSADMIAHANALWGKRRATAFLVGGASPRIADYAVASGLFNVRIDEPIVLWEEFVADTLRSMAAHTRRGFAVNFLAVLPEGMNGASELYRCDPQPWIAFCERELGTSVTLLDRYGMREFTLLVRH